MPESYRSQIYHQNFALHEGLKGASPSEGFKGASGGLQAGFNGVSRGLEGGLKVASRGLEGGLKPSTLKRASRGLEAFNAEGGFEGLEQRLIHLQGGFKGA